MRIAWFTPFHPRSAIGQYSDAITRRLAEDVDLVLFADGVASDADCRPTPLPRVCLAGESREGVLRRAREFDLCVYNLGDFLPYHREIFEIAQERPGLVVLHDLAMHNFFAGYFLQHRRDPQAFARCMAYCHGTEGEQFLKALHAGEYARAGVEPDWLRFSLHRLALRRCLGVVVHSNYARGRVAPDTAAPVAMLNFPLFGASEAFLQVPAWSPSPDGRVRLLTFGVVNRNKQIHAVIEAIGGTAYLRERVRYLVIGQPGEPAYERELVSQIDRLNLGGVVALAGYRSDEGLRQALTEADLVVNLRNPHLGESSASLLTALLAGRPALVWGHGHYDEFPNTIVTKIHSEKELAPALERLCRDPQLLLRMGGAAREHALSRFNTDRYCARFRDFSEEVLARQPLLALADTAADLLLELGVPAGAPVVERLGRELAAFEGSPVNALHAFLREQHAAPPLPLSRAA
jgi:glycosyltransferase involved in cell wall biosynthesis